MCHSFRRGTMQMYQIREANQQATDDGLSDRNVTSDVHVRTANYSTRCSERPDR